MVIVSPPDCKDSVFLSVIVFRSLVASRYVSVCDLSWMVTVCGGDRFFVPCGWWFVPQLWKRKTFSLLGGLDAVVESPLMRHMWVFLGSVFFFWQYHMTCRMLVLWPGVEYGPRAAKAPNHWATREFLFLLLLLCTSTLCPSLVSLNVPSFHLLFACLCSHLACLKAQSSQAMKLHYWAFPEPPQPGTNSRTRLCPGF